MPVMYGYNVATPVCTLADANFLSMVGRDDGCKGLLQLCNRYRGKGYEDNNKVDTMAQFSPARLLDELNDRMRRQSQVDPRWLVYGDTDEDVYCTVNTMQPVKSLRDKGVRGAARCVELRMLYWDIDAHGSTVTPQQVISEVIEAIERGALPPMAIVDTGRGCGLYIPIKPESAQNEPALMAYKGVAEAVYRLLCAIIAPLAAYDSGVEVDRAVVGDIARIARLPATANTATGGNRCHAVDGYAYTGVVDLFALADYLNIDYDVQSRIEADKRRREATELARARDIVARYTHRNTKVRVSSRSSIVLEYLRCHPLPEGQRHNGLLAAGSTLHDDGAQYDDSAFRAMAACCSEPLTDREIAALSRYIEANPTHMRSATIEDALSMPTGTLGRSAASGGALVTIDLAADITPRLYRWAVGYLVDHDPQYTDTRVSNRTRDAQRRERKRQRTEVKAKAENERAERKAAKAAKNEKARQLIAAGVGYTEIMQLTGLSRGQVSKLKHQ